MVDRRISIQVKEAEKRKYDKAAADREMSLTALVKAALGLYIDIPADFMAQIERVSETLKLTPATILCHMIIKRAAFDAAWLEVFGAPPPGVYKEFRFDESGLVTGDQLSELLKAEYVKEMKDLSKTALKAADSEEPTKFSKEALSAFFFGK